MDNADIKEKITQIEGLLEELKDEVKGESNRGDHQDRKPDNISAEAAGDSQKSQSDQSQVIDSKDAVPAATEEAAVPIGEVGTFEGEFVIMPNEKKYQVPPNYASKAKLIVGDQLKLMRHGDRNEFQIVKQVGRVEVKGILTKKDFQWTVLVDKLEFRLIPASVRFHNGEIGDQVEIILPENYLETFPQWAALKGVIKMNKSSGGFAGSKSATDIEKDKKFKHVPGYTKKESKPDIQSDSKSTQVPSQASKPAESEKKVEAPGVKEIKINEQSRGEITFPNEDGEKAGVAQDEAEIDGVPALR